ncbi:recombinase XerC [Bacillus infantis]|uniref:Recombinase XerC n=1 Tax=Bacillus infantis TaxID=324767 RepID=A0A5D4SF00_9BACI|nr:recombinase XerC [Bacillus infantis]TYS60684.1 recombinase XerC [Bacillus infantis]
MPYGYEEYRLSKGISPNTTKIEAQLIRSLLAYINQYYKRSVEPFEIRPIDIKNFLQHQKEEGNLKDATILRKLGTIKNWFDYMWQINKIPHDFMPKLKLQTDTKPGREDIELDYSYLLHKKPDVLRSDKILLYAKMLYILYLRGFRLRDVVNITLDQIEDKGESMIFRVNKKNGLVQTATFSGIEVPIILSCMERAIFRGTPYLLSSKVNKEYVPLQFGSLKDFISSLKEELGTSFRSEHVRFAYVHYLYTHEKKSIEQLQEILGTSLNSIAVTLKEALERIKQVDYNGIIDR